MSFVSDDAQVECKVGDTGYVILLPKQLMKKFERTVHSKLEGNICGYLRSEFQEASCIEEIFTSHKLDEIREAVLRAMKEEIDMFNGKM